MLRHYKFTIIACLLAIVATTTPAHAEECSLSEPFAFHSGKPCPEMLKAYMQREAECHAAATVSASESSTKSQRRLGCEQLACQYLYLQNRFKRSPTTMEVVDEFLQTLHGDAYSKLKAERASDAVKSGCENL